MFNDFVFNEGSLDFALKYLLPGTIVVLSLLRDVFSRNRIPIPKNVRVVFGAISYPFQNFLTLADVSESGPHTVYVPPWKPRTLVVLSTLQCAHWLAASTYAIFIGDRTYPSQTFVAFLAWLYVTLRLHAKSPATPPYAFMLLALTQVIAALLDVYFSGTSSRVSTAIWSGFLPICFTWVAGTLPMRALLPSGNVAKPDQTPSSAFSCPEDNIDFWSWCTFSFVLPIINLALSRTVNEEDVWLLSPYFAHKNLFLKQLNYRARYPSHSLFWFLLVSNSLDLIIDLVFEMWEAVVGFVVPYALKEILAALGDATSEQRSRAFFWAFVTFFANLSFAQVGVFQLWHQRRCYERTRGQLFCALHYKALTRLDLSGKVSSMDDKNQSADLGKIVNLMHTDSYVIAQRFWEWSSFLAAFVRVVIALIFLHSLLGWSSFAGVAVMAIIPLMNYPLAKYKMKISRSRRKAKDKRLDLVNELLQNIRCLRFNGWEISWSKNARDARETELKWRIKDNVLSTLMSFLLYLIPPTTILMTFVCYTLFAGQDLSVSKAFTSIALFSHLQGPLMDLPGQLFALLDAYISMQRINEFLQEEDVPKWVSSFTLSQQDSEHPSDSQNVAFHSASFQWHTGLSTDSESTPFTLGPLNIAFPKDRLTLVSGATGSGKSALLMALLGEMKCISGSVQLDKSRNQVAYCAQITWLEHATIRQNILFGSVYDEERYNAVIHACALEKDLEALIAGDMTEIGERGIILSGGQKARLALARAMYSQAKYILLDDPLSAVDVHTAEHIVEKCLMGDLCRGRTIILVTHHVAWCLPTASYLVELSQGKVLHQGTIQDLRVQRVLQKLIEQENEHLPQALPEQEPDSSLEEQAKSKLETVKSDGKLIKDEFRKVGRVSMETYWTYIKAAGIHCFFLTVLLLLLDRLCSVATQVFLAKWSEAYHAERIMSGTFFKSQTLRQWWEMLPLPQVDIKPWLVIYISLSLVFAVIALSSIALSYYASYRASRALFYALLQRLTRAPTRFFDTTPIGRILNRFTSDINTLDDLQSTVKGAVGGVLSFLTSFFVILVLIPSFAPFALIIAWLYARLGPSYIHASRDLRRLESVHLSPTFAGFDELLRGLAHVRAFGMESHYQNMFYKRVDNFQSYDHIYWLIIAWLRWRYDCLGSVLELLSMLFALQGRVSEGFAAIIIVQATSFSLASKGLVRVLGQAELNFNSVERISEYLQVAQEAPAIIEDHRPPAFWPSRTGDLTVENLTIKYAPDLPPALRNLSFTVKPGERIAVVGRTGSGKSTLAMSILRIIEPTQGRVIIDGIDVSSIGLSDLRNRVALVSQDVALFSGTVRSNLDPLNEHTDMECLDVLQRCHLAPLLKRSAQSWELILDMQLSQGGSLSAGERQLVALARALLRRTNIVILDEATSQIDMKLDELIQKTIREELSGVLVITIAHRLSTILDYDRVLVLDDGQMVEFAEPRELLRMPNGRFKEMCRRSADWPILSARLKL